MGRFGYATAIVAVAAEGAGGLDLEGGLCLLADGANHGDVLLVVVAIDGRGKSVEFCVLLSLLSRAE